MSAITFATLEDAVAADVQPVRLYVRIGGEAVTAWEATTRHDVDQEIGTCSVILAAPRPASLAINAEIEIEAGYAGATRRIFHGRIPNDHASIDNRGAMVRVTGQGWASYLREKSQADIELAGPISLKDAFRALCELRGVPTYLADDTTYVDGVTEIMLGGNSLVDGGDVVIPAGTSPLSWISRTAKLFGYRVFDSPDGAVRLARVSGLPNEASAFSVTEGVNALSFEHRRDIKPTITWWTVEGARYTAEDGGIVQIRSIPDSVPEMAELAPLGFAADIVSDSVLVTASLAEACRNVREVDNAAIWTGESWDMIGHPGLQPGDVVTLTSTTLGLSAATRWLTGITQSVSSRGYLASMESWAGAGSVLPAGTDSVSSAIGSGTYHMGNQTISRYRSPSPLGASVTIPITVTFSDYTSLRITGLAHGTNSYGRRTASTGSKIEIHQLQDPDLPESGTNELRSVGSIELPTLDENTHLAYNYAATDDHWTAFSLPISGTLRTGAAEVRLIAGTNADGRDDYEITDLMLVYAGVGIPDLPTGGA